MAKADHAPGLERAFEAPAEEMSVDITHIEGELPPWLAGTYYFNGPARFERGAVRYQHWLDGDGMVGALRLSGSDAGGDGSAHFTARYVRSHKVEQEEAAGRALFRTFGTRFAGDQLLRGVALASPVNVSVYPFAGKLLAFGEQGLPWELDPETLETLGEYSFNRRLTPLSPFSAHPKIDPDTGELFNFGISFATAEPTLTLYRFDREGGLIYRKRSSLDLGASVHDFGLSGRWIVVYLAPHVMDVEAFLRRGATVLESLTWEPERGSRLLIFSRETGELAAEVPVGCGYCLHHIHAFEEEGEEARNSETPLLTLDVLELEEPAYGDYHPLPNLFEKVKPAEPMRYRIDVERGEAVDQQHLPWGMAGDFPAVDPALTGKPYDDFWLLGIGSVGLPGRKFLDHLVHLSWADPAVGLQDLWTPPGTQLYLAGEPAYAAAPPEATGGAAGGTAVRGALVVPQFDARRRESSFLVFDAYRIARGPLAKLHLEAPIHLAFHSHFEPRVR